jgi:RHS repeat-associated protein
VVSAITWLPFGPISSYKLGNGQTVTRSYHANYALTDLTSTAFKLHVARDSMGNLTAIGNAAGASPATETYSYDPLYRLTGVTEAGGTTLESFTYNPTGDRLSKTSAGLGAGTYSYTSGTHQLASIGTDTRANDAAGNTIGSVIGGETYGFGYNGRNRMALAQRNGDTVGSYSYNALGQRIGKVSTFPTASNERFAYDEAGHLLAEYGSTNRDYLWLGDLPIAIVDNTTSGSVTTSTVNYITADQLGTPRAVSNSAGTTIWSWAYQGNPFGQQAPTSSTGYVLNLRYPGQYFDVETGTNYNYFRTYEPATGRYLQSDPLGLIGGVGTFTYSKGNVLENFDPLGLYCLNEWQIRGIAGAVIGGAAGGILGSETCPGALVTAGAGAIINGGLGVVDGLMNGSQASGAATGAGSALSGDGTKIDMAGGVFGGAVGGAVSAQMENDGYPREAAVATGGATGGTLGAVISGYLKGIKPSAILKGGLKGEAVGVVVGLLQTGLEDAIRAGNECGCHK